MMLELRNIFKTYDQGKLEVPVLKNISLTVDQGEYVAIMGPSGSGKTTLMNIIGCLDKPSSGEYLLEGEDLAQLSEGRMSEVRLRSIGFVFQSFHLLPRQSALDNVALPLLYAGVKKKERHEIAKRALERVGLGDRLQFKPTQLSGGQCQRVAIARAMVNDPKLLLADEPTGALDTASGEQIMALFEQLNREGVTIVMITHERDIAAHAHKIYHIRDGRLVDEAGRFLAPETAELSPAGSASEGYAPEEYALEEYTLEDSAFEESIPEKSALETLAAEEETAPARPKAPRPFSGQLSAPLRPEAPHQSAAFTAPSRPAAPVMPIAADKAEDNDGIYEPRLTPGEESTFLDEEISALLDRPEPAEAAVEEPFEAPAEEIAEENMEDAVEISMVDDSPVESFDIEDIPVDFEPAEEQPAGPVAGHIELDSILPVPEPIEEPFEAPTEEIAEETMEDAVEISVVDDSPAESFDIEDIPVDFEPAEEQPAGPVAGHIELDSILPVPEPMEEPFEAPVEAPAEEIAEETMEDAVEISMVDDSPAESFDIEDIPVDFEPAEEESAVTGPMDSAAPEEPEDEISVGALVAELIRRAEQAAAKEPEPEEVQLEKLGLRKSSEAVPALEEAGREEAVFEIDIDAIPIEEIFVAEDAPAQLSFNVWDEPEIESVPAVEEAEAEEPVQLTLESAAEPAFVLEEPVPEPEVAASAVLEIEDIPVNMTPEEDEPEIEPESEPAPSDPALEPGAFGVPLRVELNPGHILFGRPTPAEETDTVKTEDAGTVPAEEAAPEIDVESIPVEELSDEPEYTPIADGDFAAPIKTDLGDIVLKASDHEEDDR